MSVRREWSRTVSLVVVVLAMLAVGVVAEGQVSVGDRITLRERDADILAHPGPGDDAVSFRFEGGSAATVLAVDPATTWVEIDGTATDASSRTG